ncbi:MAG: hypothetical protein JW891_08945 [Candidatus Lokiarchaeota archaeon]|nr:hypothetical protein [Candidatus Lokiarchaeota archaeon]
MTVEDDDIKQFMQETNKQYHSLSIPFIRWKTDQLNKEMETHDAKFYSISSMISEVQLNIQKIFKKFASFEKRLEKLESGEVVKKKKKHSKISEDHFYRILKVVYKSMEKRFGDFVSVSALTEKIKEYLPLPTEKIHTHLYELFMEYKIDLQTGKNVGGTPLIQDGKEFVWFKFK